MFEKVNPSHPDKVADRIAGAIVDLAYKKENDPRISVEVLIGHGSCFLIIESSVSFDREELLEIVFRISRIKDVYFNINTQDSILSKNQSNGFKCGDNGIFKGMPVTEEQHELARIAKDIYSEYKFDGKYVLNGLELIVCQSNAEERYLRDSLNIYRNWERLDINPLGYWVGGLNTDSGATNRKLGSDMGDAVTGGGLHGKDLSKADVTLNICAHIFANMTGKPFEIYCAIGDDVINGLPYSLYVEMARNYIDSIGGFESFAEWGLIRE